MTNTKTKSQSINYLFLRPSAFQSALHVRTQGPERQLSQIHKTNKQTKTSESKSEWLWGAEAGAGQEYLKKIQDPDLIPSKAMLWTWILPSQSAPMCPMLLFSTASPSLTRLLIILIKEQLNWAPDTWRRHCLCYIQTLSDLFCAGFVHRAPVSLCFPSNCFYLQLSPGKYSSHRTSLPECAES